MNKLSKAIVVYLCVLLPLITLFLSVGYAAITTDLSVVGSVYIPEPKAIRIIDVKVSSSSNVGGTPSATKAGYLVFQHGNYTLNTQSGSRAGGKVTISITVKNSSGVAQYFTGHSASFTSQQGIAVSYSGLNIGDKVNNGETRTFTITIQNTSSRSSLKLNAAESVLNFSPEFNEDHTSNAASSLAEIFRNVLNGNGVDGEGKGIVYKGREIPANRIMTELTNLMESVDTGGYIGNVGNASQDQKDMITAIFGDQIMMEIGSQYYSVSLLIKNQQIDGKGANDMVMYVTADQLTIGGGRWSRNAWVDTNVVPVYGLVFINNGTNNYTYCEHLFAGEAPVCDFGGAFGEDKIGNFNTNLWNSTEYTNLSDTSGGTVSQDYITTNGELDEAYQRYISQK